MKWVSDGKGLQYREHTTRKHGLRPDRYYRGRYKKEMEHFRIWINPVVGALPFKKISRMQAEKIKKKMQRAKRSPRTIQYVFSTFGQVWKLAKSRGLTSLDNPLRALKSRDDQVHNMALVSLDTGARFSEVSKLKWGHLDIDGGAITYGE
jgi:integrase